jgi:hypothetical protein
MTDRIMDARVWDGSAWQRTVYGPAYFDIVNAVSSVTVPSGSPAHTKGAWIELFASTSFDADDLSWCPAVQQSGAATATLYDIAIGPAGSEVPLIENWPMGSLSTAPALVVPLPGVAIPAGSRVSVRAQSVQAAHNNTGNFRLAKRRWLASPSTATFGANTTTSRGTPITAGAAWTELVAATPDDYLWVYMAASGSNAAMATVVGTMELAIGAAGLETSVGSWYVATGTTEVVQLSTVARPHEMGAYYGPVPAGTRLSGRCSIANVDLAVIAGTMP